MNIQGQTVTLKLELDLELNGNANGNGIDNSPPLPGMRTSPCACLHLHRYCTADITPAGMWPSHKQDLSPAADRLGVCVSPVSSQVPPVRPWPVLLLLVRGRGRPP